MSAHTSFTETWRLRAGFAAALSRMYGAEVPAYTSLVDVATAINREHSGDERLGSLDRVTAERHGAIRVGSVRELAQVADLFAAFGMYPVGYYDLREAASPVPVVSTAFRPIDADELAHNPFRVFTSMLATADPRFFPDDLRSRVERFVGDRQLFDPALIADARRIAAAGGAAATEADDFVARATAAFELSREPIDTGWYTELSQVSAVAADIAGVRSTHINHLTPRVVDIDELYRRMAAKGIVMNGKIEGPPRCDGPDVLLRQTSFRALGEPRWFRDSEGTVTQGSLRVRFGEVEARGVALTPKGRERYDAAMSARRIRRRPGASTSRAPTPSWPHRDWPTTAAATRRNPLSTRTSCPLRRQASSGPTWTPTALPSSTPDESHYSLDWMAGAIGHHVHDPYDLYEKAAS